MKAMDQQAEQAGDGAREPETSVMAIGSLVAGILGLSFLPAIGSLIALGLGYAALREVRDSEVRKGERLAMVGVVLGWLGVAVTIVGVCLALLAILLGFTGIPGFTICGAVSSGF
jgi:hypothetical protein